MNTVYEYIHKLSQEELAKYLAGLIAIAPKNKSEEELEEIISCYLRHDIT